jgi:histidyl-tRNA synthetase
MPLKYYYIISCFRHEAPQAGRSREFFQFGTELFGSESAVSDATAIAVAASVFRRLGLRDISLHINSIGCPACRGAYRDALTAHFSGHREELCDTCRTRLGRNPLRLLDCKSPICSAIARKAPKTVDYLCDGCREHFEELKTILDGMGIDYTVDPSIVRGLDYYTRTVFEFIAEGIGAQSTVCGGGRYDGLVESLGGAPMPGIGFGMGLTRVVLAMEKQGLADIQPARPRVYIAALGSAAQIKAAVITERLRREGIFAECDVIGRSLKAQMKYANKIGADYTLILGDNEIASGRAALRDMKNSTQTEVELDSFTIS